MPVKLTISKDCIAIIITNGWLSQLYIYKHLSFFFLNMKFILSHNNDIQSIDTCRFCFTYQRHILAANSIFIVPPRYSWNIVSVRRNIYKYMKSSSETRGHILKIAFPPWINSYKVSLLTIFITQIQKFVCEIISSYERFTTLINIWNKTEQQS